MDHPISKIFVLFMFLMQLLDVFTSTSTEMEERNNTNSDTCYQSCCTHFVTRNLDSSNTEESQTKLSWPVYILVCLFGLGSWLAINGIWMELPVLVDHAPEKWSLPSYLTVITELANVGPLIYFVGNKFAPKKVHERTAVYTITILGSIACVLLTLFWDKTSHIFGSTRSTALIVLSFFVALVDCTSTVTFLPFMAILPQIYMSALFLGENLSSLLPSFVALIQGVDKRKLVAKTICDSQGCQNATVTVFTGLNFGPNYFFLFLAFMMLLCGIAFIALNYLSAVKKHHVLSYSDLQRCSQNKPTKKIVQNISEDDIAKQSLLDSNSLLAKEHLDFSSELALPSLPGSTQEDGSVASRIPEAKTTIIYLFILQAWINSISNGAISQIQAYACEPYGATAYHLAATLSGISSALVCIAFMWIPTRSSKVITFCCLVYTALSAYIIMLAAQSPHPILQGSTLGSTLVVLAFMLSGVFVNYAKLAICAIARERGRRELFWCGVAMQIGSFIGAIVMFPLVNVVKLFKQ